MNEDLILIKCRSIYIFIFAQALQKTNQNIIFTFLFVVILGLIIYYQGFRI